MLLYLLALSERELTYDVRSSGGLKKKLKGASTEGGSVMVLLALRSSWERRCTRCRWRMKALVLLINL